MDTATQAVLGSGPDVARLFRRLLCLIFLIAWASIGSQLDVLIESRGLLPIADFVERLEEGGVGFSTFPSLSLWFHSDAALQAGWVLGALAALLSLFGVLPRLFLALSTVLYLSYVVAARSFTSFQWDNLLIECGALAIFLSERRRAPFIHFLFRVALFKLYFESGLAKYQSMLGDWQDGSAMTYYYETAPIPTWLGWYAHHLPAAWHHFESRATLVWEIGIPFLIFLSRPFRLIALLCFTAFQMLNLATANYGFFCYLALVLGVFLLDDRDVRRFQGWARRQLSRIPRFRGAAGPALERVGAALVALRRRLQSPLLKKRRRARRPQVKRALGWMRRIGIACLVAVYLSVSLSQGLQAFGDGPLELSLVQDLDRSLAPFRVINVYHLFAHITRRRIEPEVQTYDGERWTAHDFKYKPGDPARAPPFVAPHQPRVDFLLWFYGLSFLRGGARGLAARSPEYVVTLVHRVCSDPEAVQSLFTEPLPSAPQAARLVFYEYHFTESAVRQKTGAFWQRSELGELPGLRCARP